jgi:hypothetical protein
MKELPLVEDHGEGFRSGDEVLHAGDQKTIEEKGLNASWRKAWLRTGR